MQEFNPLGTHTVCQVAVVVDDIAAYAKRYARLLGMPVPEVRQTGPAEQTRILYRGQPTEGRAKLAFFQAGPQLAIELIEPVGGPSIWREHLDEHGPGVHHIAFRVPDMDRAVANLADEDMPVAQSGHFAGGRYAYIDSVRQLGVMLELLAHDDR